MEPSSTIRPVSVPEIKRELRLILESDTFRHAPKLSRLLSYVCNKAMLDESDQVTEYTIGVDVFEKPENFKESKDSNVRVEIHRLRKRLAQFYENEGRSRPLRMVIPSGRYTPEFLPGAPQPEGLPGADAGTEPVFFESAPVEETHSPIALPLPVKTDRTWIYGSIAIGLTAAIAIWFFSGRGHAPLTSVSASAAVQSPREPAVSVAPTGPALLPLRITAGYEGPPHTDGSGHVWGPDRYFEGGRPARRTDARTARTNDPFLFQNSRIGDFSYAIPLPPGAYELHLYFIESEYGPEFGNGENDRTIFVHINNRRIVPEVDIESDAMGIDIADERVFKDVSPAADGKLHVSFESGKGVPLLNAIEILPGLRHRQLPIRLVAQPAPFTGRDGVKWQPDNYYLNGRVISRNLVVADTADPGLFAMERYGHFTYAIPVDVTGRYGVTLHFAELYFGSSDGAGGGPGSRVFNVMCNGVMLLENFDIFRIAGSARAVTRTFHNLKPTAQGKLNLTFEPVVNYALISAIEVTDESE